MKSEYSKWFWTECDELNKDTSFAHRLAEKAWDFQQSKVDEITQLYAKELFNKKVVAKKASEKMAELQLQKDELQKRVDKAIRFLVEAELYQSEPNIDLAVQALKGGSTINLNTDENGECRHFSTTLFQDSKAECFHCDAVVNEQCEIIGKQSKGLHPFFKKELL